MPRAVFEGVVLAETDRTVVVEGNHYFPPGSLVSAHLREGSTRTVCPWKGLASYRDAVVDGVIHPDVGWCYVHPTPLARRIRDHVAFDRRVTVEAAEGDVPRRSVVDRLLIRRGRSRSGPATP